MVPYPQSLQMLPTSLAKQLVWLFQSDLANGITLGDHEQSLPPGNGAAGMPAVVVSEGRREE